MVKATEEDGLEDLLGGGEGLVWVGTPKGRVLYSNEAFRRFVGCHLSATASANAVSWTDWLASSQPGAMANVQAAVESGRKAELVVPTYRLPSGKQVAMQVSLTPLAEGSTSGEGILGSAKLLQAAPPPAAPPASSPFSTGKAASAGPGCEDDNAWASLGAFLRNGIEPCCIMEALTHSTHALPDTLGPGSQAPAHRSSSAGCGFGLPSRLSSGTLLGALTDGLNANGADLAAVGLASMAVLTPISPSDSSMSLTACGGPSGHDDGSGDAGGGEEPAPPATAACLSNGADGAQASVGLGRRKPSGTALAAGATAAAAGAPIRLVSCNQALEQLLGYTQQQLQQGGVELLLPPGTAAAEQVGPYPASHVSAAGAWTPAVLVSALTAGASVPRELLMDCRHASGRVLRLGVRVHPIGAAGEQLQSEHGQGQQAGGWRHAHCGTEAAKRSHAGGEQALPAAAGSSSSYCSSCSGQGNGGRAGGEAAEGGGLGSKEGRDRYARGCNERALQEGSTASSDGSSRSGSAMVSAKSSCADVTALDPVNVSSKREGCIGMNSDSRGGVTTTAGVSASEAAAAATGIATGSRCGRSDGSSGGITHGSSRACDANGGLVPLQDQQQQLQQQQNQQQGLPQHSSAPQQQAAPRPQRFMLSFVQRQELNSTAQYGGIASGAPQLAPGPLFGPGCPVASVPARPTSQTVAPGTASTPQTAGSIAGPAAGASPAGLQVETRAAGWLGGGSRGHGDALLLPAPCSLRDMALDAVREGIVIADPSSPDSPLVYTNTAFLTMSGYSREEVLGRNCRFLQGPDTDPRAVQAIRDAIARRADVTVTLVNYTKGGTPFWNELRLTPVTDPGSGRLLAYIGVQNDVTELVSRKESEARMRDAKEAAESATEAKSQFVANMSHEIRTPLNGMIATAQLLLASVLTPEQRELTETILESGSALLGILGDILDFSKIDHGSLELQRQPMCLRQATEACLELVAAEAAKKGLALAYLADDAALGRALLGDPVRVRQVLANLLSNAVKFTERGEVVVHVTVEPAATCRNPLALAAAPAASCAPSDTPSTPAPATPTCSSASAADTEQDHQQAAAAAADEACMGDAEGCGEVVHFAVADTGIGIGAESARKLFQHFRQGSETMSRRYGGTGLGLAISKRLAQLMCGDIWVESELGKGSTFHFTLKAEWAQGPWSPPTSSAASPADSVNCTPRSSTEVLHPGVGAAVVEGITGGGTWAGSSSALSPPLPPAVPVPVPLPPGIARSSTSSTSSGSTARTGRELRKSPWLPDGTPVAEGDCGASGSGSGSASAAFVGSPLGGVSGLASPLAADCLAAAAGGQPGSSSNSVTGYVTSGGGRPSSSSGVGVGGAAAEAEAHESALVALHGRTVLVDVSHAALSRQVWNSCRQLGLAAVQARACGGPAGAAAAAAVVAAAAAAAALTAHGTADGSAAAEPCAPASADAPTNQLQQQPQYDILVVSMDRLVPAFKAGWKGRPVVALGDREQLPPALQPLVVVTVLPVRHSRLCNALVKSTALLKWNGNSAPKLGNTPIPSESIQMLKSWRMKKGPAFDADAFNRRTSLDNSVLERAAMARGAAAGAAGRGGAGGHAPRAPVQAHLSIPENSELAAGPEERLPPSLLAQQQQMLQQQATTTAATPASAAAPAPAPSPSTTPGTGTGASGAAAAAAASLLPQQLRILIAEDNKVNQKVVLKVLQQILRGCQPPDVVENGLQVLQALQKKTYDLILMDIHMPEMDGLEASKRIQETYKPEERPRIIALSADTVQTLHDRCREAGIEAFLVKPFRIEDLARVMRTHNRVQRREGEAAPGRPPNGGLAT